MTNGDAVQTVRDLVVAVEQGQLETLGSLLSEDFQGHVTTADGTVRAADREAYVASIERMDVRSAGLRIGVPTIVAVEPGRVLVMVEVHAARGGRTLHNFSAQLATVVDGVVTELWMVEALPAESDVFWSS